MKVTYEDFIRLKQENDYGASLVLKDLRENQPDIYALYEKGFERTKTESKEPEEGLALAYDDITTYEQFKETIQKSNKENEYHGSSNFYTKRLNRFIARDRQQYIEFLSRLKDEYRNGG